MSKVTLEAIEQLLDLKLDEKFDQRLGPLKQTLDQHTETLELLQTQNNASVEVADTHAGLEYSMSPQTAFRLRSFSADARAKKSTGVSHLRDRDQWHMFIIAAHTEDSSLDFSTLAKWLHAEGGWSDTAAHYLATEYESARHLLRLYASMGSPING